VSKDVSVAPFDALKTLTASIEALPSGPMPTDLASNLFDLVMSIQLRVSDVGTDMLSNVNNVFVTDEINAALADLQQASKTLMSGDGKGRFFTSRTLHDAKASGAATVDIPNYARLLANVLLAAQRTIESLSTIENARPKVVNLVTNFFKPVVAAHDAVVNYINSVRAGIEDAARKEAGDKADAEARGAAFWVKMAAGGVLVATGIWFYRYVKRQKLLSPAAPRLRHR
jgi:hypothetical protein